MLLVWKRSPRWGQALALLDALAGVGAAGPPLWSNPLVALTVAIGSSLLGYAIWEGREEDLGRPAEGIEGDLSLARGGGGGLGALVAQALFYRWSQNFISPLPRIVVGGGALALVGGLVGGGDFAVCALVLTFFFDFFLLDSYGQLSWREDLGVEFFLNHPGRVVIATFVILCGVGSILLYLPFSTKEPVDFLDAAFSAVSSVCVTGLSILDVERDFTPWGRFFLVLLMQLGGLGMMSLSALVMHVLGRRMSLRHERLAVSAAGSSGMGEDWWTALGDGLFMSVTAFCNVGMAPYSSNVMEFANQPAILYTLALVGICGGLAPAACLALGAKLWRGRSIPLNHLLALVPTAILLLGGMLILAISEWNGLLAHLAWDDKLHNAFFLSAAARTIGFNSLDLSQFNNFSYVVYIFLMLIGGSPGGTAGGMKTTT